ncbi:hypothetical protein DRO69_08910 [Candidatus Bathyarchaeota archaeon]|nr:MAG: hypothetical protein DRO69_08910 [Candidatus Bathyarchaeota archaeon]
MLITKVNTTLQLVLVILVTLTAITPIASAQGNAEVSRTRNLNNQVLSPNNADITRNRNMQCMKLKSNNVDVTRYLNLQYFQVVPGNVDVTRYGNLQFFQLEPNDAHVTRYRNLQVQPLEVISFGINITNLATTDQNNNPQSAFLRGEIVQFSIEIKNIGNYPITNGLISITVFDPTLTTVLLAYTFEDIEVQQTKQLVFGYSIPQDAILGTYTAKVSVFTDWPHNNGLLLDAETKTFTVN